MIDIDSLNWSLPIDEQRSCMMKMLPLTDEEIKSIILPPGKQACWANCAILLSSVDDVTIDAFLPQLLEWYKDLNWPGVEIIHKRLLKLPVRQLESALISTLHNAAIEKDDEWLYNLSEMFADMFGHLFQSN